MVAAASPAPPAKLDRLPAGWGKIQREETRRLLAAERRALDGLREDLAAETDALIADIAKAKAEADERRRHAALLALLLLRGASLQRRVTKRVADSRYSARRAGFLRLQAELGLALMALGLSAALAPKAPPADVGDGAHAHLIGSGLAAAWKSVVLGRILESRRTNTRPEKAAADARDLTDGRLRRIAATEVPQAYNEEHRLGAEQAARAFQDRGLDVGLLVRRWDAVLDGRVCRTCSKLDGDVAPIGQPFASGYEPAFVHPFCRCQDSLVLLPNWKL